MTHEIEVGDYMLDDAVNDATRIWRDVLAAFAHAQEGEETVVRLGTVPIARIVPPPWVHTPEVPVRTSPPPRWAFWRGLLPGE